MSSPHSPNLCPTARETCLGLSLMFSTWSVLSWRCTEGAQKLLCVCSGGDGPWGTVPSTGWSHCWYISCLNPDTGRIQLCRKCLGPFDGTGEWSLAFRRCAPAEDLYHQVRDLDEEVSRLCSICSNGKKTDCIF